MTELDAFITRGHQKIIDHYRWLRDTASSAAERERYQRCINEGEEALRRFAEQRLHPLPRAA